ncbi:VanZ family protein [Tahibacter caeni]|uniref:VanZ family protein n=1 Tax=Tahibacter caeni TaxID=1453545 RepID=UPI0021485EB8|nr:VanZ family protein [Tahibacter caeni]
MIWHPRPLRFLGFWRGIGRGLLLASLIVALLPAPAGMGRIAFGDKIAHLAAFAFLMLWYAQIYALPSERLRCALGLIGFGLGIELLQSLVPYRSADVWDLVADAAGVGLGLLLARTPLGGLLSRCEPRPAA